MRGVLPLASLALLLAACGQQGGDGNAATAGSTESNAATATAVPKDDLGALLGSQPRLAGLIKAAGMEPILSGKEPYTLLAPTDQALDALPAGTLERLQSPAGKAELTGLLRHHILPGTILIADLARAVESGGGKATLATMAGDPLTVTKEGNAFRIGDGGSGAARFVGDERPARNGVVHSIDAVLPLTAAK
jgi:uncharacterized surface protein with fasciclin (FAS1) repeats